MTEFFIQGEVPSSKNNKKFKRGYTKDGRFDVRRDRLISSDATYRWINNTVNTFLSQKIQFRNELKGLSPPYYIEFTFIRKTKAIFDYHNMIQVVADTMVRCHWLEDDNANILKPYYGDYQIDPKNPGVIIKVLRIKPNHYGDIQTHTTAS